MNKQEQQKVIVDIVDMVNRTIRDKGNRRRDISNNMWGHFVYTNNISLSDTADGYKFIKSLYEELCNDK